MVALVAAVIVAAAIGAAAVQIVSELRRARQDAMRARQLAIAALFAPTLSAVQDDPKALLAWQPLAHALRHEFSEEFAGLDRAAGGAFPFSRETIAASHARWTTEWLAWERTHDATYKLKALEAQHEQQRNANGETLAARTKLESIEREKLDTYQRRYEEYVRVSKALERLK